MDMSLQPDAHPDLTAHLDEQLIEDIQNTQSMSLNDRLTLQTLATSQANTAETAKLGAVLTEFMRRGDERYERLLETDRSHDERIKVLEARTEAWNDNELAFVRRWQARLHKVTDSGSGALIGGGVTMTLGGAVVVIKLMLGG